MNEVGNFNITHTNEPINSSITVIFLPASNVTSYTYEIHKEGKIINNQNNYSSEANIHLTETGTYQIKIIATLNDGSKQALSSGYYMIDKEKPEIIVKNENLEIKNNYVNIIKQNVTATDNVDGNMTSRITANYNDINLKSNKNQKLTYTVVDNAGNIAQKEINIKINNGNSFLFLQGLFIAFILISIILLAKVQKAIKLEKRIEPYTLKPIKNRNLSISEKLIKKYQKLTKKISKYFSKSELAKKYSKKLEKYLPVTKIHLSKEDILSGKILVATLFVIIAVVIQGLRMKLLQSYEIVLIFTIGFFALDILYIIKYKVFRWKLESDFIAAITIMNNAFKSGRSITQAIDIVSNELNGIIGEEFNRMSLELLYGLELDVVFKRFAKRINLEEANYLTASLTILNKTGGDIIKVFDSIERSMFDKRKLKLELSSLTSGSKIVVSVLLGMPFFFCLVISIINPAYFIPFFTTPIGGILLIFMIIYYIIFVVVVRKVMKVVI